MNIAIRVLLGIIIIAAALVLLAGALPRSANVTVHAGQAIPAEAASARTAAISNQDAREPGRHPFQGTCSGEGSDSETLSCRIPTPSGSELVVENVSLWVSSATPFNAYVVSTVNDYLASTYIPLVPQQGLNFVASTPVKLYVDPGAGVRCTTVVKAAAAGQITCTISGHLVAVP
jgi:hypothetical protein